MITCELHENGLEYRRTSEW